MIAEALGDKRMSFGDFCMKYLRHHFPLPDSKFHDALKARLDWYTTHRGNNEVWIAPRGNAKSTLISLAYILYCICMETEKYIVLVSDTQAQGVQFLADIKTELEHNAIIRDDFPHACGKSATQWNNEEIITRNNIKVVAMGMRGKIRGRKFGAYRPTLIIIDDPENDESAMSPRQRERTRTWLTKGAVAAGVPKHTNVIIIGTVINADCLVEVLKNGEHGISGWTSHMFKSVIEWPDRMDLWDQWTLEYHEGQAEARAFYEENRKEMDAGALVLWPERENLYTLFEYRASIGTIAFESEKQNRAINPDQCMFREDWFDDVYFTEEPWFEDRKNWFCFGACDPSVGKDAKRGDYCPILTVYWKRGHKQLYVYTDMKRRPNGEIIDRILDLHVLHNYDQFVFEDNGFQAVLADSLVTKMAERGMNIPLTTITHTKPKDIRIQRLGVYLEHAFFRFEGKNKEATMGIKQLKMYPNADHDDFPDCLEMLLWLINEYVRSFG
jgi:predicted phage terminase large subunit-like protein